MGCLQGVFHSHPGDGRRFPPDDLHDLKFPLRKTFHNAIVLHGRLLSRLFILSQYFSTIVELLYSTIVEMSIEYLSFRFAGRFGTLTELYSSCIFLSAKYLWEASEKCG